MAIFPFFPLPGGNILCTNPLRFLPLDHHRSQMNLFLAVGLKVSSPSAKLVLKMPRARKEMYGGYALLAGFAWLEVGTKPSTPARCSDGNRKTLLGYYVKCHPCSVDLYPSKWNACMIDSIHLYHQGVYNPLNTTAKRLGPCYV